MTQRLALFGDTPHGFYERPGAELWTGFKRHGLPTHEHWYVSNILKQDLPNNRDPKRAEIDEAIPVVLDELLAVRPSVIVTAGAFATQVFLGDVPMAHVHGIPHEAELEGRAYTVVPIYHPAAGLHNKGYLSAFDYDLGRVAAALRGELRSWRPSGRSARTSWLRKPPSALADGPVVAVDTEGWPEKPWGLSFCVDGQHSYVIPACFPAALQWFTCWLRDKRVVMHNGLHDQQVLAAMGVTVGTYDDTQVLAYHEMLRTGSGVLEAESQNLGTLAYRELCLKLGELSHLPGVDFEKQEIPYTEAVLQYAGEDAIATRRLFDVYEQAGLVQSKPYQIDMGQVPLVAEMIANGMPFDVTATSAYYAEVTEKELTAREDLCRTAGRFGMRDFNPGSHPQVRTLLTEKMRLRLRKRTKGGLASTSEKALANHQHDATVAKLQSFRELSKLRGTYLRPLLEELSQ